jgi:hypothetical protein
MRRDHVITRVSIKVAPTLALLQKSKGGPTTLASDSGDAEEFVLYEVVLPSEPLLAQYLDETWFERIDAYLRQVRCRR